MSEIENCTPINVDGQLIGCGECKECKLVEKAWEEHGRTVPAHEDYFFGYSSSDDPNLD